MRKAICCFLFGLLAFCLYLKEMLSLGSLDSDTKQEKKMLMLTCSSEQIQIKGNWARVGMLQIYFKKVKLLESKPRESLK